MHSIPLFTLRYQFYKLHLIYLYDSTKRQFLIFTFLQKNKCTRKSKPYPVLSTLSQQAKFCWPYCAKRIEICSSYCHCLMISFSCHCYVSTKASTFNCMQVTIVGSSYNCRSKLLQQVRITIIVGLIQNCSFDLQLFGFE